MEKSHSDSYRAAGVDVTAGYESVRLFRDKVASTFNAGVLGGIGGFGGFYELPVKGMNRPVTVSGTDGVGTKLKIAFLMDKHDTVGIDCVAMCANDVVCSGAAPAFFLDYISCGRNIPDKIAKIVSGVADGCVQAGCALIGGETAEHPGLMPEQEYDLAGFCVGVVDYGKIITGERARKGDAIIGLASSGVHSNGFSLVRRALGETAEAMNVYSDEFGKTVGEELLTPTRIYVKSVLSLINKADVHAVSHITGGGFYENIPRMLPDGLGAVIDTAAWRVPPVFNMIAKKGDVPSRDMYNTYNMGIGMALAVSEEEADEAVKILEASGERAYIIGEAAEGESGVTLK